MVVILLAIVVVVVVAGFLMWRKLDVVGNRVSQLDRSHNTLKRQVNHGVILDDPDDRVDLRLRENCDDDN